jgi:Large extracellular alpha-helical protein
VTPTGTTLHAPAPPAERRPIGLTLLALLLVGLSLAYLIASETPRGTVAGVTVRAEGGKPLPDCDVYLTPLGAGGARRRARTDAEGRFTLRRVPAGLYAITASSKWHEAVSGKVTVAESQTATATIRLKRTEPDINIGQRQKAFATDEKPILPVRGYVSEKAGVRPELQVTVWRTRASEVLKRADAAEALQRLDYTYDGPATAVPKVILNPPAGVADAPELVAKTTVPIQYVDREGFYHNRIPLDVARAKPGLYLAQFTHGGKSACSYLLVTDMAVVTKRSRDEVLAYAVHLRRGTPVAGAEVRAYRNGRRLDRATADTSGLATLRLPPSSGGGADATVIVATHGQDEAVVDRAGYWWGDGSGRYVLHTVTDRTVYRPGDTIQFKGIARLRREGADGARSYGIPRGVPVTLEMRDPTGALVLRMTRTTGNAGTFWGAVELSPEGTTGTYSLIADIGGEKHTRDVPVASYKKPEFTVTVTPAKPGYLRGDTVEMTVEAAYYFGTPVAGAKVRWSAFKDADWSALYGDDLDDDTLREYAQGEYGAYYGEMVGSGEVTLGADGRAVIRLPSVAPRSGGQAEDDGEEGRAAPQAEVLRLTAEVEDESQRLVQNEGSVRVTAGERFVRVEPEGYVAAPGKPAEVFVVVRDLDGRPVPDAPVTLSAAYQKWDPKTEKTTTTPVGTGGGQTARTGPDGRALLHVTPPRAGDLVLTATTRDPGGRAVAAESDLWVTGDAGEDLDTDYGDLALLTDKREYAPGETARVLVNTARTGQTVLLTVEGERIYRTIAVPIKKRSTVVEVPVRAGWGPNVFLSGCYVRDKKFASNTAPLRVALAARELTVTATPTGGDRYGPGDTVTYVVETKDAATGRPVSADFSLSVVDESIYALRADDPKALRRTFYPRRSQEVSTSYSFAVEYLGDMDKSEPQIAARRRFRDTADWKPDQRTDASGRATVSVTLPDNLTTWRATVQAVSDDTAVGYGVSKVVSTKPFFVRLEAPRFLTGGDRSRLLALVHNETGREQTVLVRLLATALTVEGKDTRTLTVPAGGIGRAEWPVVVSAAASGGTASVRVTAWTPQKGGSGGTQYTDGIEQSLPLRAYGRTDFATFAGATGGEGGEGPAVLRLDENAAPAETRLTLRVTPSLRGALVGSLDYLIDFPYGCTEQTMSRFYPTLLAERLGAVPANRVEDLPRLVRDGVARLARLQHGTGGWGWWQNDSDDAFMTAYVLVGLSAAKAQGYPVDEGLIRRGVEAAEKLSKSAPAAVRPFVLYALAEAGYDDSKTNLLRAPFRYSAVRTGLDLDKLPPDALAYLVLLARRLGEDHRPAYNALQRRAAVEGRLTSWKVDAGHWAHGSDRMATALGLRALMAVEPEDRRIPSVLRWLMQSRTDSWFGNTRDTAWVLVAFCDYLRHRPGESADPNGTLEVRVNNQVVRSIDLAADSQGEPEITLSLPADRLKAGPNQVEVVRTSGSGTVFYSGALRQTVAAPAGGELAALTLPNGIKVEREVVRVLPRKVGDDGLWRLATEPVPNGVFRQGDRLRVRVKLTVPRDASYVLIEDAFPSGAEVTERGTADQDVESWSFWYDHVEVRDDRIAFFARRLPAGTHVLEYNLRAQTPGTSHALPTHVEGMYDASVRAESATGRLEVKP